jgi:hypothetical protein
MLDTLQICKCWLKYGSNMQEISKAMRRPVDWISASWNDIVKKEYGAGLSPDPMDKRLQIIHIIQKMEAKLGLKSGECYKPTPEEYQKLPQIDSNNSSDSSNPNADANDSGSDYKSTINEFGEEEIYMIKSKKN